MQQEKKGKPRKQIEKVAEEIKVNVDKVGKILEVKRIIEAKQKRQKQVTKLGMEKEKYPKR